jgi:methylase of polypeptide subunit release factors
MPRIPPTLLRHARCLDRLLPSLLPICRDLSSAQNELRWLGEHAAEVASKQGLGKESRLLQRFVNRRARGEPLQYILGTEFFGELEIKCRPGVLIPRWVGLNVAFHKMFVLMFDFI